MKIKDLKKGDRFFVDDKNYKAIRNIVFSIENEREIKTRDFVLLETANMYYEVPTDINVIKTDKL